jgi:hypothetical protein
MTSDEDDHSEDITEVEMTVPNKTLGMLIVAGSATLVLAAIILGIYYLVLKVTHGS